MAFKDILVHVDNSARARVRLKLAAALARIENGHLVALHVRGQTELPPYIAAQVGPEIIQMQQRVHEQAAAEARALFDAVAVAQGFTSEWRDVEGNVAEVLALHARYADLTVIGQSEPDEQAPGMAEALTLEVGRPVLVVPYAGTFSAVGERVMVAWNASREATRAVHDALPLLRRARRTHVLTINPEGHGDIPGADICLHLSRHGVKAECEAVSCDDLSAGQMLLSRAADMGADLIVMGAYGGSRLRRLVLGGATGHLLRHMTVPVLFSH
ncbi:MAG TPA: universal stress protein [Magnetospirillum sp.]|jgi:nucleotide-binding universal stress UspA family protein|nr:universal stress protein [Magnetospirillum sp.]